MLIVYQETEKNGGTRAKSRGINLGEIRKSDVASNGRRIIILEWCFRDPGGRITKVSKLK